MNEVTPGFVTAKEAARFLGVTQGTIWVMVRDGRLPKRAVEGLGSIRFVIPASAVKRLAEQRQTEVTP